jgi:hypothetical protein
MIDNDHTPLGGKVATMDVKIFLTADFANIDSSGKLNILGTFTEIRARKLPVVLMQLFVVVQLEFDYSESEQHRIAFVKLFDPDGAELATLPSEFDVPKIRYAQTGQVNVLVGIQRIPFSQIGPYEFKLFLGDNHEKTLKVEVKDYRESTQQHSEG